MTPDVAEPFADSVDIAYATGYGIAMLEMAQVVLDTNVLVSALRSRRGASFKLVDGLGGEHYVPCLSTAVVLEYEDVLLRQAATMGYTPEDIGDFIDFVVGVSRCVPIHFRWRPFLPDAGDECFLELAVAARADAIVTYNKRHFLGVLDTFGVKVLDAREFLQSIGVLP